MKAREARKHYNALSKSLGARPANTAAHHVVSWYDERAEEAREILRRFGIHIDSEFNGVYLPTAKKNLPHPNMPDSYSHTEVHTKYYYTNMNALLAVEANIPNATRSDIEAALEDIATELQEGTFPLHEKVE